MKNFDGKKCALCAACCGQQAAESERDPTKDKYDCPGALAAHAQAKKIAKRAEAAARDREVAAADAHAKKPDKNPARPGKRPRDAKPREDLEDDDEEESEEEDGDDGLGGEGEGAGEAAAGAAKGGEPLHSRRRTRRGEAPGNSKEKEKEKDPDGPDKPDPIARRGPLASHAMTDARALESILDAIANARYRPQDVATVTTSTALLRAELFSASADVLHECLRATSDKPTDRAYEYRYPMETRSRATRLALGMALRAATRWGEAFARINFARHAADAVFASKGTAFLDKPAKVSAEMAFWSAEIVREQPNEMRGDDDLPTEYDLSQQVDYMVIGLHLATVRPRSLRTFMDKHSRNLVAAFVKDNKKNLLSFSAWQAKHGAKASDSAADGGRRAFRRRNKRGGGLSGGGQSGGGKGAAAAAAGGAAASGSGSVPPVYSNPGAGTGSGKTTRTKCSTCGKYHLGACWHAAGAGGRGGGRGRGRGGRGGGHGTGGGSESED